VVTGVLHADVARALSTLRARNFNFGSTVRIGALVALPAAIKDVGFSI